MTDDYTKEELTIPRVPKVEFVKIEIRPEVLSADRRDIRILHVSAQIDGKRHHYRAARIASEMEAWLDTLVFEAIDTIKKLWREETDKSKRKHER